MAEKEKLTKEEKKAMKAKAKAEGKTLFGEFKAFITRGNVVDMAIGVVIAGAFTAIVTAFTKGFISPIIALLTEDGSLSDLKWILRPEVLDTDGVTVLTAEVAILWGAFLQTIVDFLLIALVLFLALKVFHSASLKAKTVREKMTGEDKKKAQEEAEKKAKEAEEKAAQEEAARLAAEKAAQEEARKQEELELLRKIAKSLDK